MLISAQRPAPPLVNSTYVVADTETTGIDPKKDRVVQFALVRFANGRPRERFSALVDPGIPIPATASAVHLLRDADVCGRPTLKEYVRDIVDFAGDSVIVAHNAPFDKQFLPMLLDPWICTLRLARRAWPDSPRHTNSVLRFHLGIDDHCDLSMVRPHDAESDAIVTGYLFGLLLQQLSDSGEAATLADVHDLCWRSQPPTHFFYGKKWYGSRIDAIDDGYLGWVMQQHTLPENQRRISVDDDTLEAVKDALAVKLFSNCA